MKILLFILLLITLQATELEILFDKLNNVEASQRYKIMNKIKIKIKQMNNSNRMGAINILNKKHNMTNKIVINKSIHKQMINNLQLIEKKDMRNMKRNIK